MITLFNHNSTHSMLRDNIKSTPLKSKSNIYIDPLYINQYKYINDTDKIYKCLLCNETFSTRNHLHKHVRIHITPQKCPYCPKRFSREDNLTRHINSMHNSAHPSKKKFLPIAPVMNYNNPALSYQNNVATAQLNIQNNEIDIFDVLLDYQEKNKDF